MISSVSLCLCGKKTFAVESTSRKIAKLKLVLKAES
jgi:hypothetical protein